MVNNFDISAIEAAVTSLVKKSGVSSTVYNNRPKAAPTKTDFVVVKVSGDVLDKATHGEAMVEVSLFAKDVENTKNGKKLGIMYRKFIEGIVPALDYEEGGKVEGSYLIDTTPSVMGDTPDDFGFHARIINIKVIIKSI